MIKRSFFGSPTPRIQYLPIPGNVTAPAALKQPESVTLLVPCPTADVDDRLAKKGDLVKTGQKISLSSAPGAYGIASLSGTLSSIDRFPGEAMGSKIVWGNKGKTMDKTTARHKIK